MELTKDTVRRLTRCMTRPELEAALATWPSDPVTWSWFLGDHITGMSRADGGQRVQLATAAARRLRKPLPRGYALDNWAARAPLALWREYTVKLGAYFDGMGGASSEEYDALAELVSTVVPSTLAPLDEIVPPPATPPAPVEEGEPTP